MWRFTNLAKFPVAVLAPTFSAFSYKITFIRSPLLNVVWLQKFRNISSSTSSKSCRVFTSFKKDVFYRQLSKLVTIMYITKLIFSEGNRWCQSVNIMKVTRAFGFLWLAIGLIFWNKNSFDIFADNIFYHKSRYINTLSALLGNLTRIIMAKKMKINA